MLACFLLIIPLALFFAVRFQARATFRDVSSDIGRELDSLCENYLISRDTKKEIISRNDRILVYIESADQLRAATEEALGWNSLLGNANPGINGFSLAVSYTDESILWAKDSSLIGRNMLGFYAGEKGDFDVFKIDGTKYYALSGHPAPDAPYLYSLIPAKEVNRLIIAPVAATALAL